MLEQISTAVAAIPIPIPLNAELVVASVGQVPKRSTRLGFSLMIPLVRIANLLAFFSII